MKTTFLTLLALGVLVTSCNEKVSPDLDTGASATSDTAVAPDVYTFEVVNDSPVLLNYKLHRTGAARGGTECKVSRSGNPLTNTQYIGESSVAHDLKNYDITCFFEAEELSLYFSGIDFAVKASQNTCEYIGYSPFSYFNFQPGDSSTTLTRVKCDSDSFGGTPPLGGDTPPIPCDSTVRMIDPSVSTPTIFTAPSSDGDFCKYDYSSSEGPNCDIGNIMINETHCKKVEVTPATTPATHTRRCTTTPITVNCGGKALNCIDGPIKKVSSLSNFTTGTEITQYELNKPMEIKYSLEGGVAEQRAGNFSIANYRRDLANPNVQYDNRSSGGYNAAFSSFIRVFDPLLMETYARNRRYRGAVTDLMVPAGETTTAELGGLVKTKPLAADPFMGVSAGNRVNPFYTFYCFDTAFDIKARIRMVVRDWDRVFSTDPTELEKLTDLLISEPRQDNNGEEVIFDPGNYNGFNDKPDWDDIIPMERSAGPLTPATFWEPYRVAPLTGPGFFNPDFFPKE